MAVMLDRLSIASSTSGGTDTFSRTKLVISMPYLAVVTGLINGRSASPSSLYLLAASRTGMLEVARASLNTLITRERIVLSNSASLKS